MCLCIEKLDSSTTMYWQSSLKDSKEIPSFDSLLKFLDGRIQAFNVAYGQKSRIQGTVNPPAGRRNNKGNKTSVTLHTPAKGAESKKRICALCQKGHSLGYSPQFKGLSRSDRWSKVKALKICVGSLSLKHGVKSCPSQAMCHIDDCKKKHHFLLHQSSNAAAFNSSKESTVTTDRLNAPTGPTSTHTALSS